MRPDFSRFMHRLVGRKLSHQSKNWPGVRVDLISNQLVRLPVPASPQVLRLWIIQIIVFLCHRYTVQDVCMAFHLLSDHKKLLVIFYGRFMEVDDILRIIRVRCPVV